MAESSEGWDGTVDEAAIARILNAATPPRIESGFTISTVAGARRVILAPGVSHHAFVRYANTSPVQIDVPAPAADTGRWYLLVHRRNWATNDVATVLIAGDVTSTTRPVTPPTNYPADVETVAGVKADCALFWIWVRSTETTVRTWPIVHGRPIRPQVGTSAAETYSDFVNPGAEKSVLPFTLGIQAIAAGAVLHLSAELDVYTPAGDVGGYLRVVRYTDGAPVELGSVRWHNHSRGTRWLAPTVLVDIILNQQIDAGTNCGVLVSNDPLSNGVIEVWSPRLSWSTV